ncbi:50S ribosomal protein L29 [Thiohalocapsa marina]|uniref:Large ribosomal subunit protein uL29 n=1 Tax=Thiohalocapsa marina TaxID=424902 RepID=A0A5M8FLW5_9GAMM|nr:50S ribosomal protein L29 [Thiohalocapsa marina]KAA6184990.1 50S ribosomal protein L29 [Thiohalocapsa marina]
MKASELRGQSREELDARLHELLREQFNLRMQKGSNQLSRPSQFKLVRREIARIKTVMAQKLAEQQSTGVVA